MTKTERSGRGESGKRGLGEPRSWEEVNQRLSWLGELERQLRWLRDQFEQKVAVLKQQWLEASQGVAGEKQRLERQVECFYWAHRDEVLASGRKSVELAFGQLGSRHSRSLVVEDAAAAQKWLAAHGLERYLRVRTEIDREAIRSALLAGPSSHDPSAAELLGCPGLRLREGDEFWYRVETARPASPSLDSLGTEDAARTKPAPSSEAHPFPQTKSFSKESLARVPAGH
jgi:phage host-nuclease inhibitor protein Gam